MRIKSKLSLGLGFLFLVIVVITAVSVVYINTITKESKELLKDNYESVQISQKMLKGLDLSGSDTTLFFAKFEASLILQEKNITEPGEMEHTRLLRIEFDLSKTKGLSQERISKMKGSLYLITDLNLQAIQKKNELFQEKANRVLFYIGVIGAFCFIMVFTFIINFPGYIANPIKALTQSIKEISEKKYDQRLEFTSKDEFGELAQAFNTMAEKLQQYESSNMAQVMFEKQRIEAIINNMQDVIVGLNENKLVLFANREAVKLSGLEEIEMLGKYAPNIAVNNFLLRLLISDNADQRPIKLMLEGRENYFTKENITIHSAGNPIGEVILLKNITRYEELDQAKTNFIATISHELKTPIAAIKLSSKLLEDDRVGDLNDEQQQLVHNIKGDAERLLKITSELLNMTQVETGKIQLNFQKVHPCQIINHAVEALRFQAEQKGVQIKTDCREELHTVNADVEKTVWVLVNLLSNALRYSPDKENIYLKAEQKGDSVIFSVQDFGIGIAHKYQEKIFEKYFRIPGSKKEGTGLGLAISKEFIEAQGGRIALESVQGKGSTFFFALKKSR